MDFNQNTIEGAAELTNDLVLANVVIVCKPFVTNLIAQLYLVHCTVLETVVGS